MKTLKQFGIAGSLIGAFILGTVFYRPIVAYASQLYRNTFTVTTSVLTLTVDNTGAAAVTDTNSDRVYLSLVNSGPVGVSCFPSATSTNFTYGGGWWLVGGGGAITFDSVAIYGGPVTCITATSASTTVGVVER